MVTWAVVESAALQYPRAELGAAHDGSPAVLVGRRPFARRREDQGREILQFWCRDRADVDRYRADPETYLHVAEFSRKATAWALLERLDLDVVPETLAESWFTRTGRTTDPPPDYEAVILVIEGPDRLVFIHPGGDLDGSASLPAGSCRAGHERDDEARLMAREQTGLDIEIDATISDFVQLGTPTGTMRAYGLHATPGGRPATDPPRMPIARQ